MGFNPFGFHFLTIFTHIDMVVIGQGILCISVCKDMDVSILFLLTCLIQNLREEGLRKSLGRVPFGLAFFIGRNLPGWGYRHNRFNFIILLCCINCYDPSLDIL